MHGGFQIGHQQWGTSCLLYWPFLAVGGKHGHTISHYRKDQGRIVLCWWWRTLSVAVAEVKREVGEIFEEV